MKLRSVLRLGVVLLFSVAGLIACTQAVKTGTEETPQSSMQAAKDAYQRKDYKLAAELFRKAADQGDAKAQYNLGMAYDTGQGVDQDYTLAAQWYRKAALQGLPQAQNNLGILYKQGQGVTHDYGQAVDWFLKAADQGFPQAQHNLGLAYRDGQGVKKDATQAALWLRKAAEQGDEVAQADLKTLKTAKPVAKNTNPVKPATTSSSKPVAAKPAAGGTPK